MNSDNQTRVEHGQAHSIFSATGGRKSCTFVDFTTRSIRLPAKCRIENKAIGINYIDTLGAQRITAPASLPSGPAIEAAGVVTKVEARVSVLKPGDRVVYAQRRSAPTARSRTSRQNAARCCRATLALNQGAASFPQRPTVYYLLRQTYDVQPGEVFCSMPRPAASADRLPVGESAARLIGSVGSDEKAALAKQAGAWATINYHKRISPSGGPSDAGREGRRGTIRWVKAPSWPRYRQPEASRARWSASATPQAR